MQKEFIDSLVKILERDLLKLEDEIRQYSTGSVLWIAGGDTKNPGGNLALHLCGNLQHYIGKVLGNTSYTRNRDLEFSAKNVPKDELILEIRKTRETVIRVLKSLDHAQLDKPFPAKVFDYEMTTAYFLIHLSGHLNYHLGQINYHRRMLTPK
jgi:hypothetical protein